MERARSIKDATSGGQGRNPKEMVLGKVLPGNATKSLEKELWKQDYLIYIRKIVNKKRKQR